jgi:3'(2'),5'-bisphosphate nucleotidase
MTQIHEDHDRLLPAIQEAAAAVLKFYTDKKFTVAHKDPENPVTDADFAANTIILAALKESFPLDGVLSEESDSAADRAKSESYRQTARRVWVIDPIDGTRDFIRGRPEFAVSVGLVEDGRPVLGFVANPAANYLLSGGPGIGLYRDGVSIPLPERKQQIPPRIVISRSEFRAGRLAHLQRQIPDLSDRAIGSIAYKLALVADGTYDLVISVQPKNEWDIAGGAALVAAAGLKLYEPNYSEFVFNKPVTESQGVVCGTDAACDWYRNLIFK